MVSFTHRRPGPRPSNFGESEDLDLTFDRREPLTPIFPFALLTLQHTHISLSLALPLSELGLIPPF